MSKETELSDEQIEKIAKPYTRSVGDHWCNETAIPDNGSIEDFARAIIAADRELRQLADPELAQLHENGAKAWSDVPDATAWVDELRGSDAIDASPGRDENQAGNAQMPVVSVEYQHEDTGIVGHVDEQQVEWGFFKNNPRLQFVCNLVRQSDAQAALAAVGDEIAVLKAERDALRKGAERYACVRENLCDSQSTLLEDSFALVGCIGRFPDEPEFDSVVDAIDAAIAKEQAK